MIFQHNSYEEMGRACKLFSLCSETTERMIREHACTQPSGWNGLQAGCEGLCTTSQMSFRNVQAVDGSGPASCYGLREINPYRPQYILQNQPLGVGPTFSSQKSGMYSQSWRIYTEDSIERTE